MKTLEPASPATKVETSCRQQLTDLLGKSTLYLVIIFTLGDLIAGFCYWLHTQEILKSRFFELSRDRSLAEIIQYFKYGSMIAIINCWYRLRKEPVIKAWLILFILILLDDSLGIHEFIGKVIVRFWSFEAPFGIRAKDLAEIFGFAMVEGLAFAWIFLHSLKAPRDLQLFSLGASLALAPMIGAGVVLDVLPYPLLEQVGEMLAATLLLAYVHNYYSKKIRPLTD